MAAVKKMADARTRDAARYIPMTDYGVRLGWDLNQFLSRLYWMIVRRSAPSVVNGGGGLVMERVFTRGIRSMEKSKFLTSAVGTWVRLIRCTETL